MCRDTDGVDDGDDNDTDDNDDGDSNDGDSSHDEQPTMAEDLDKWTFAVALSERTK